MKPLEEWDTLKRGYKFGVPTFYSDFHLGTDIICLPGTKIYAWEDLEVTYAEYGQAGGNTIWCETDGKLFRFLHLKLPGKKGKFKKGEVIGITGNTGTSTGPHVHVDISLNGKLELNNKKNFTDPDVYFNNEDMKLEKELREAFKKAFGTDYGENMNEGEQKEGAKDILELDKSFDELNKENEDLTKEVMAKESEIKQLKALLDQNAQDTSFMTAIKFVVQTMKKW